MNRDLRMGMAVKSCWISGSGFQPTKTSNFPRDCDFGLVVGVSELFGVFLVEFGSEAFVWMDLEREGFGD